MGVIILKGTIADGKLTVDLPADAPEGEVEVEIRSSSTLGDLLKTGAIGAWAHRTDIEDSVEFGREIRKNITKRNQDG